MPFDPLEFEAQLRDAFPEPERPRPSRVGKVWDTVTQPLKSLVGVTGGIIPKALSGLLPEEYAAAQAEQEANILKGEDRPLTTLEQAEALPGLGDVLAKTAVAQSLSEIPYVGALAPVARLGGNILGDPTTYVGGAGAVTKIGKAQRALETALKTERGIEEAAAVLKGAEAVAGPGQKFVNLALERLSRPGAFKEGAEAALSGGSLGERLAGVGRAVGAIPFSPLPALAYAPEIAEGIGSGARETFSQLQQGNYGQAAASGVNTALQAGLAGLMAKGLLDEATAREVLAREAARERISTGVEAEPVAVEAPSIEAPAQVEAPLPVQEVAPPPQEAAPAVPADLGEPITAPAPTKAEGLSQLVREVIDGLNEGDAASPKSVAELLRARGVEVTKKDVKERLPQILKSLEEDLLHPAAPGGSRTRRAKVVDEGGAQQTPRSDAPTPEVAAPSQPPIEAAVQVPPAEGPPPSAEPAKIPPKVEATEEAVTAAHIENNLADRVEALHREGLRSGDIAKKLRDEVPNLEGVLAETGRLTGRSHKTVEDFVRKVRGARKLSPHTQAESAVSKFPWDMTAAELDAAERTAKAAEAAVDSEVLGDRAAEYNQLQKVANGNSARADEAARKIQDIENSLTEEQRNKLFGIGQTSEPAETYRAYRQGLGALDWNSPQDLGKSLRWAITRVGKERDPHKMNEAQRVAYTQLKAAYSGAVDRGWNPAVVSEEAIKAAGARFKDPEDAAFMLEHFAPRRQPDRAQPSVRALPPSEPTPIAPTAKEGPSGAPSEVGVGRHESFSPSDIKELQGRGAITERQIDSETGRPVGPAEVTQRPIVQDVQPRTSSKPLPEKLEPGVEGSVTLPEQPKPEVARPLTREQYAAAYPEEVQRLQKAGRRLNSEAESEEVARALTGLDVEGLQTAQAPSKDSPAGRAMRKFKSPDAQDYLQEALRRLVFHSYEGTSTGTLLERLKAGDEAAKGEMQGVISTLLKNREQRARDRAAQESGIVGAPEKLTRREGLTTEEGVTSPEVEKAVADRAEGAYPVESRLQLVKERLKNLPASKRDKDLFMAYRVQPHITAESLGIDPSRLQSEPFAELVAKAHGVSKDTVTNASKLIEMQLRYSKPEKGYSGIKFGNNQKWSLGSLEGKFSRQTPKRLSAEVKTGQRAKVPESFLQLSIEKSGGGASSLRDLESTIVGLTAGKSPSDLVELRVPKNLSDSPLVKALSGKDEAYLTKRTPFLTAPLKRAASEGDFDVYRLTGATIADMRPGESTLRKASEALTPAEMKARIAQYDAAIKDATPIGGTRFVAADLDGDGGPSSIALAQAKPLAEAIGRAADEIGKVLGEDGKFAGFTPSSFLFGVRTPKGVFINPLHAIQKAEFFTSRAGNPEGLKRVAATNIADTLLHEVLHSSVEGHGEEFAAKRAELIRKLGPSYKGIIETIESGLDINQLKSLMPEFSENVRKNLGELAYEKEFNGRNRPSNGPRADLSRPAPLPGERGRAEGRPPTGVEPRPGPGLPVRGGTPAETGRPGASPELRGTLPQGNEAAGAEGGSRGLISDNEIKAAEPRSPEDTVNALIRKGLSPEKASFLYHAFGDIPLKHTLQDLLEAGPKEKVDISVRMKNLPGDPEVKARLAQALEDRGRIPEKVSWADLDKATLDFLGVRSTDEAVRALKQSGLKDGKDVNTLRSVAGFYLDEVSRKRKDLLKALEGGNETKINDARTEVGYAVADMLQASEVLSGGATNIGRALNAFRKPLTTLDPRETLLRRLNRALTEQGIKKKDAEFLTDQYSRVMEGDVEARKGFLNGLRLAQNPEKMDMVLEAWKAGLLGYPTQIANIASNALFRGMNDIEGGVAVLLDKLRSSITGTARERYLGELPARWAAERKAMAEGLLDYSKEIGEAFALKEPNVEKLVQRGSSIAEDIDVRRIQGFIPGKVGRFVRFPFQSLEAADAFFKHIARSGEYGALSYRLSQKGKGTPAEILAKLWEASRVPQKLTPTNEDLKLWREFKDVLSTAEDNVKRAVFQKPLGQSLIGRGAKLVQTFGQQHKAFQFIAPFTRTPANILDEALVRTPLGMLYFLNKARKEGLKNLKPEAFDELAKSATGSALMGGMLMAGLAGNITGAGPQDPALQETLRATGWQPYSFKLGNQYISYSRFEPIASLMGMAADAAEGWQRGEFTDTKKTLERLFESVTQNVTNKTFLAGLEGLFSAIHDPFRYGEKFLAQLESTIVPNTLGPIPVATLARAIDPAYRQTEALSTSPLQARIPGLSQELPAQLTPLGEERSRGMTAVERLAAPWTRSEARNDPQSAVAREFDRLNWSPRKVERFIRTDGGAKIALSDAEIQRLNDARQMAIKSMWRVINDPTYKSLPDEEDLTGRTTTKKDVLDRILRKYQRVAMNDVRPRAMVRARREERQKAQEGA